MRERTILSEKLEDSEAAAKWGIRQGELIKKGDEITRKLSEKYTAIILSRNAQGASHGDTKKVQ